jgi:predicted deacylase
LKPGKHALYFQGVQMPTGQHRYLSVTVAKGEKPGQRVLLVSGVHGDEMSSVHTVQTVMNQLDPEEMSGTVMAVADVSGPALEGMQRRWPNQGGGIDLIDMNREWPGNENGVRNVMCRSCACRGAPPDAMQGTVYLHLYSPTTKTCGEQKQKPRAQRGFDGGRHLGDGGLGGWGCKSAGRHQL